MSMKRSRAKSSGSSRSQGGEEADYFAKPQEPEKSWAEHMEGKDDGVFVPYSLATKFAKGQLLTHPKFGKGVVVNVEGPRIEVLFEEGPKKLGHAA
jgi:hypothetical protein